MVAEAAEEAGHDVRLLDLMFSRDPAAEVRAAIAQGKPEVIGLSVRNIDNNDMQGPECYMGGLDAVVGAVRESTDAPVVLGGAAAGVMPAQLLRRTGALCAVTADGQGVFPELLENLSSPGAREMPGTAWPEDGSAVLNPPRRAELRAARQPDYPRWLDMKAYSASMATVPLQTKLGCHFRCVYCTYRKIEGNRYRCLSPEDAAAAVEGLVAMGLRDIEFVDNVFNAPYAHAMAVCGAIAHARPGARLQSLELNPLFVDGGLLSAMGRAGFSAVGVTAESASDQVLEGLGKGFTRQDLARAAGAVRRHSLPCLWIFMLGGPGETEATVEETIRFAETELRPSDVAFFNAGVRIYPGTALEAVARREGLLSLPPSEMLEPVFYLSPGLDPVWLIRRIGRALEENMNFTGSATLAYPHLPLINRLCRRIGLRPPLWRHTRHIRRGLRMLGAKA